MTATEEAAVPAPRAEVATLPGNRASGLPAKVHYANALADSGLLPRHYQQRPANILWAMEYGEMLGLTPMAAITGVHVIEGKPAASAGLISALVRRAGHQLRVKGDTKSATCQIIRSDDPRYTFEVTFTIDDAKTAGLLSKDVWKKYPASMLKARAITQCARDACEEALFGLHYTPEELGAEVDEDGVVVGGAAYDEQEHPASRGRGTVFIDPDCLVENDVSRAAERGERIREDDPWYVRPDPDAAAWPAAGVEQAATLKSKHAADKLWRETNAKANAGEISDEDTAHIKELITARVDDIHHKAFDTAMGLLAEDEAWRDVIDGLADAEEARDKLEELTGLAREGTVDARREQRISRAIVAWITWKFPKAAGQESAA